MKRSSRLLQEYGFSVGQAGLVLAFSAGLFQAVGLLAGEWLSARLDAIGRECSLSWSLNDIGSDDGDRGNPDGQHRANLVTPGILFGGLLVSVFAGPIMSLLTQGFRARDFSRVRARAHCPGRIRLRPRGE